MILPSSATNTAARHPRHLAPAIGRRSDLFTSPQGVGLLCALLAALAVLFTYPVLEMGTSDDWSYARTVLDFLRTGHIVYNGWATAMLGWQIAWGALAIKLFGFSFLVLRLSTLPFTMAAAYLLYQVCLRSGLTATNSVLATLTVVLSPVFLPLATSFMTDIPALFWLVLGLYACLRAISARSNRACIYWLAFASLSNVVAGSARQIIWLVALVMVPCAAWISRKRPGVMFAAALLWVASLLAIAGSLHWFYQQPYSIPEKIIAGPLAPSLIPHILQQTRDMAFSVLLLSLPVLSVYLSCLRQASKRILLVLLALSFVLLAARIYTHGAAAFAPWLPNMVTEYGVGGSGNWESVGQKPVVLQPWIRALVTCLLLVATCAWLSLLLPALRRLRKPYAESVGEPSWKILLTLLGPFTLAYCALLMPRAIFSVAVDRYLIPLIAVFALLVLRSFQDFIAAKTPRLSFALLAVFSAYGIAVTHDYFATGRARLQAASLILSSGVPRTGIQGGWEYDGWTQLSVQGHINDPRLQVPPGAYKPVDHLQGLPSGCRFQFAQLTPAVNPQYFVEFSPQSCLAPSRLGPITYQTWLPPFQRQIYIQQRPTPAIVQ